ncbi:MAG TPA: uroporphyrinogen decarboxylase [Catalimonadaceae bacterium]|nr:uroporphyrinogen decarboxylase [Catalimonadaceae bacterium]
MMLKNDLLLRAARGEKTERVPVWLMRQAGRILPEYRAVRASLSGFKELVETPERAAEVTIQPVDILGVDAAIIFSDILVVAEGMGLTYEMEEKRGPFFPKTIETINDIKNLRIGTAENDFQYTIEAIRITKKALNGRVPLIGFAGAPFTMLCYMVEGGGSKTFSKSKKLLFSEPEAAHMLLQKITDSTIDYLKGQVAAGADLVQVFDSWAGILSPQAYEEFSMPYLKQIADAINEVPVTLFGKGAFYARKSMAALNCQVIGTDWNMDPQESRALVGNKTLQGNLDPCVLYGSHDFIAKETRAMIKSFGSQRYIANLGHGVYPDTDPMKVKHFVETVQSFDISSLN